jgi:hypothetical protein
MGTGVDDAAWVADASSLPDARRLIEVTAPDGRAVLVLDTFVTWRAPAQLGEDQRDVARRELQYALDSFLVRRRDLPVFIAWGPKRRFWGGGMSSRDPLYRVHLGEFHWAPAYRYDMKDDRRAWARVGGSPASVMVTTEGYLHESGNFDCSIDESISLHLPSRWLAEAMKLRWNGHDGRWYTPDGIFAMEDPTAREAGPAALVARRDILVKFLRESDLTIIWTIGGERRAVYPIGEMQGRPIDLTGFYWLDTDDVIQGSVRTVNSASKTRTRPRQKTPT